MICETIVLYTTGFIGGCSIVYNRVQCWMPDGLLRSMLNLQRASSRTCRIGLVNWRTNKCHRMKVVKWFLYVKHLYFQDNNLFTCVNPVRLCHRVLNVSRVATFWCFSVIFTSLIANLTRGTVILKKWNFDSVLIIFYGNNFVSKLCPWSKIEKFIFLHVEKYLEINLPTCPVSFCDVAYIDIVVT